MHEILLLELLYISREDVPLDDQLDSRSIAAEMATSNMVPLNGINMNVPLLQ